jgi:hypothetical protein
MRQSLIRKCQWPRAAAVAGRARDNYMSTTNCKLKTKVCNLIPGIIVFTCLTLSISAIADDAISIQQQAYHKASHTGYDDKIGHSVAISDDTLVIGAFIEDSSAAGVNGDQSENLAENSGAAYVFNTTQGFSINPGMNGSWANFDTLGQGFFIDVLPDIPLIFFAWFTWETDQQAPAQFTSQLRQSAKSGSKLQAVVGDDNHRWLTAQGPFSGNSAVLDVTLTTGGLFDDPQEVTNSEMGTQGTITLTFDDCKTGTVDYDFTAIGLSGSVPIRRLADDNVEFCNALNGP